MLRIVATTAPHCVENLDEHSILSLKSNEPYSLHNAIRLAAHNSINKIGNWGNSNWSSNGGLDEGVFFFQYFNNQKEEYAEVIKRIDPNLIIIGTMTLGFAGAIEIAKLSRDILGERVFILIGGKHIIETTYLKEGKISTNENCTLSLMKKLVIPKVFDLVISGDGEEIILEVGNLIAEIQKQGGKPRDFYKEIQYLKKAKGDWVAGWIDENEQIQYIKGVSGELDQDLLPFPLEVFGVSANFPVFDSQLTAHTYSYMSKGCVFDCFFCSERSRINGKVRQIETAAVRLHRQFLKLREIGNQKGIESLSAFVEDSIMLSGNYELLVQLNNLLEGQDPGIHFGGQFSIDLLLNNKIQEILRILTTKGFCYVFAGIETISDEIAGAMSKNTDKKRNWLFKNEEALKFLQRNNIKCGLSLLFGLGEKQSDRIKVLRIIKEWQSKYKLPQVVSLNYATQHPLRNLVYTDYDYVDWGTPRDSPYLMLFNKLFGEASTRYTLPGAKIIELSELQEIEAQFKTLDIKWQ